MGTAKRSPTAAADTPANAHAEAAVDPWAPGGSMSVEWALSPAPTSTTSPTEQAEATTDSAESAGLAEPVGRAPQTQAGVTSTRPTSHVVAGALVATAVIGAVAIGIGVELTRQTPDDADRAGPPAASVPASALDRLEVPADLSARSAMPSAPTESIVGPIWWERFDGDAGSLPLEISTLEAGVLVGADDTTRQWRSSDNGRTWTPTSQVTIEREIGGIVWISRVFDGETSLWQATDGFGLRSADVDLVTATVTADGYSMRTELPADGFPIAAAGDVYLPATARAELPWPEILGLEPDRPFRVVVDVDGRPVRAVSGDFHEIPVMEFSLHESDAGRFELRDSDDVVVWSFTAPSGELDIRAADVISGVPMTIWTRWDGEHFRPADAPWEERDRVRVAGTPDGILARSVGIDGGTRMWRTVDGAKWDPVDLPRAPDEGTPLSVRQGDDEAIVTAFTDGTVTSWATVDGLTFDELTPVNGIDLRARADFGWIAPPPRSEPQFHVSTDGDTWDLIDLREMLGLDGSRWDVSIDVSALGSEIFVVADRPDGRTLLIGTVGPTS